MEESIPKKEVHYPFKDYSLNGDVTDYQLVIKKLKKRIKFLEGTLVDANIPFKENKFDGSEKVQPNKIDEHLFFITERERQILSFIAKGRTIKQIADDLCISPHTVDTHRKNISKKLGICNMAGLAVFAVKNGYH